MAEFKPSFIPKKPIIAMREKKRSSVSVGVLGFLSLIIFFSTLTAAGVLYLYEAFLERSVQDSIRSIEIARNIIEPELIEVLAKLDSRINVVRGLLDKRTVIAPVFALLEESTLSTVRFEKFSYVIDEGGKAKLSLFGEAKDYMSLAQQSNVLGEDMRIQEILFSNLKLNSRGNVQFDFFALVDKKFILHRNNLDSIPAVIDAGDFEIE